MSNITEEDEFLGEDDEIMLNSPPINVGPEKFLDKLKIRNLKSVKSFDYEDEIKGEKVEIHFYSKADPPKKLFSDNFFSLEDLSQVKQFLTKKQNIRYKGIKLYKIGESKNFKVVGPDLLALLDIFDFSINDEKKLYIEFVK